MATEYQGQSLKINYFPSAESYETNKDILDEASINLIPSQTVVEAYSNGTEWYRVWSDGWIEQGGYAMRTGTTNIVTLNLPFTKTDYVVLGTSGKYGYEQNSSTINPTRTTTSFTWHVNASDINGLYWYASGY